MSLLFSLKVQYMQETGLDPDTGKPVEGKWKELLEKMEEARKRKKNK